MGLDKAIKHGKEHRREYRGWARVDTTCRNHGSCQWCVKRRTYHRIKTEEHSRLDLETWQQE